MSVSASRKSIRIVHVVDEGAWGGLATFMLNLLSSQLEDSELGEIHLVCDPDKTDPSLLKLGLPLHAYRSDRRLLSAWRTSRSIGKHLRDIDADVVILHSSFPGLWGRLLPKKLGKKLYCAHGWAFEQRVSSLKRFLYRFVEARLGRRADGIVSISASEFEAAERAGIRPHIHALILHGLQPARDVPTVKLPIDADQINLLFIGRFDRQKGLDVLIEALDDPRLAHITLWIAGKNIIGEGVEIPSWPNIKMLGWLDNDQVDGVIRQVDAMVVPSRWEGFGLVALEAMRNGRPIIASAVGGLNELVVDRVNGRLFRSEDPESLRAILLDLRKPDMQRMGEAGRSQFEKHHRWDRCYNNWRALISELATPQTRLIQNEPGSNSGFAASIGKDKPTFSR